jgi:nitronate monooxygenase
MILDQLHVPIVLAPLGGGPSTPELAAAVTNARSLGFLAAAYLSAQQLKDDLAAAREMTAGPLGVNLFVPGKQPAEEGSYAPYVERFRVWARDAGAPVGEPHFDDDDWEAKLALLQTTRVEVVSFTFGCPSPELVEEIHRRGAEVWITVTMPDEAAAAEQAGADVLVVQGAEAGGHRGSFADRPGLQALGLLPLLDLVVTVVSLPLVASGGIASGSAIAAALCAGARAAQIGTAFMLAPEAGTSEAHRAAIRSAEPTVLTRAFTGRLARGIRNDFIATHDAHAPIAYPQIHHLTAPMRRQARELGDAGRINLWAGEAHQLARDMPAAETVARLAAETRDAFSAADRRWPSSVGTRLEPR